MADSTPILKSSEILCELANEEYAKKEKILGLMFHPERKNFSQIPINKLVFNYFKIR